MLLQLQRRRWGAAALLLLLSAILFVAAAAKDSTDTLAAETNGDNSNAHSDVGKSAQPDETNPNKVHGLDEEGRLKNNTSENNNKKDNSTEGTNLRDEPIQPSHKDKNTTKSSQVKDFLKDRVFEECDPLHRCVIEKKKFIACLKVPGEDSLALSLLMDNKGTDPLDVSIMAPDYVTLAEDTVHVEADDHNETQVKVSISDAANNTVILLKVTGETCKINIHRAITRETGRVIRMRLTSTYILVPVFFLLIVVVVFVKHQRTRKQDIGPVYQKLDTAELPISIGGNKKPDQSDNWDDNWGDDWDDEEAPMTPSKPMPNPSSKGLASRRSTKDGWKD